MPPGAYNRRKRRKEDLREDGQCKEPQETDRYAGRKEREGKSTSKRQPLKKDAVNQATGPSIKRLRKSNTRER